MRALLPIDGQSRVPAEWAERRRVKRGDRSRCGGMALQDATPRPEDASATAPWLNPHEIDGADQPRSAGDIRPSPAAVSAGRQHFLPSGLPLGPQVSRVASADAPVDRCRVGIAPTRMFRRTAVSVMLAPWAAGCRVTTSAAHASTLS